VRVILLTCNRRIGDYFEIKSIRGTLVVAAILGGSARVVYTPHSWVFVLCPFAAKIEMGQFKREANTNSDAKAKMKGGCI
jgi:hypothetical protein